MDNLENASVSATDSSVTDNSSNEISADEISRLLDEPETTEDTNAEEVKGEEKSKVEEQKDNTIECPDKFKNEDGTPNIANILKSYKELEPLLQQRKAWEQERAELLGAKQELDRINQEKEQSAINEGYSSLEDKNQKKEVARLEVSEYKKYVQYTDEPAEITKLLDQYADNPSPELMEQIELEFAPEINKRVAIIADRKEREFETLNEKSAETQKYTNLENVISQSVEANSELFGYKPFHDLFTRTLYRFGDNFTFEDAQVLMHAVNDLRNVFQQEFEKQNGTKLENDKATDDIASINTATTSSAPVASQYSNADLKKMSAKELANVISKYI